MAFTDYAPVVAEIPQLVAGVLTLALALVVIGVRFGSRLNRAFALLLTLAGVYNVFAAMDDTPAFRTLASAMQGYFLLVLPLALVHLALRFREQEQGIRAPSWAGWVLLAAAAMLVIAYAGDHASYSALDASGAPQVGWLFPLGQPLLQVVSGGAAFAFALRAQRSTVAGERRALVLGGVALSLGPLHFSADAITQRCCTPSTRLKEISTMKRKPAN